MAKKSTKPEVDSQMGHEPLADPCIQQRWARFQKQYPGLDLSTLSFSTYGPYWHNLHLVIVNDARWMEIT